MNSGAPFPASMCTRRGKPRAPKLGAPILLAATSAADQRSIAHSLRAGGYRVHDAITGRDILATARRVSPRLIVLQADAREPEPFAPVARLRQAGLATPILCITSCADARDHVVALQLGADDVVAAPVAPAELLARTAAVLRRSEHPISPPHLLQLDGVTIDLRRRRVLSARAERRLTRTQCTLLGLLALWRGQPVDRAQLAGAICGSRSSRTRHSLNAQIARLRAKLGDRRAADRWIQSIAGCGYRLAPAVRRHADAGDTGS